MIETYWNEMFGEFKTGDRSFKLPGFSEPVMSPHFGQKNIIGATQVYTKLSLKLCGFRPGQGRKVTIKVEKLEAVIEQKSFWSHQKKYHPDSFPFIQRLMPFLVENQKPHFYFSFQSDGEIVATAIGGKEKASACSLI